MVAVTGKVAVVTGGRRGLGAALVDELLARGARKIYSTGRSSYVDERPEVVTVELNVRSEESVAALAKAAPDAEIVFNNAGVMVPEPLLGGGLETAVETFDVNVFGLLRVARAFAPVMAAHDGGALVNMHSVLSWLGGGGAYGASKAAAWSVTNSLRVELASQNTQVVGVHAGFIDTDMAAGVDGEKISPQSVAQQMVAAIEADAEEVLADPTSELVKASLSNDLTTLYPALQAQWDAELVSR